MYTDEVLANLPSKDLYILYTKAMDRRLDDQPGHFRAVVQSTKALEFWFRAIEREITFPHGLPFPHPKFPVDPRSDA